MFKKEIRKFWTRARKLERSKRYKKMYKEHPEYKEKIDRGVTRFWKNNPKQREIYSKAISRFWTKEERKKQSRRKKLLYKINPRLKDIIAKKLKERYKNHPYLIIKLNREKQEYYEKNPEARKKLLEYFSRAQRKIKAENNTIVKSQGEKTINNILFENNINPNYEKIELNFSEMDPVPDFYPYGKCEYGKIKNVFIEFYGGHPKSYTDKVKKNKLYKKYKVPLLILTPYELKLWNFKDYLLRKLVRLSKSKLARNFSLARWELKN